jgi:polyisoprenyl-phosphate glycosyltransferase
MDMKPLIKKRDPREHEQLTLSVITPSYNEERNLPVMYEKLCTVLDGTGIAWEWVIVDDHSADDTFAVAAGIAGVDARVRVFRFSRNFGSHTAITCGLDQASGKCAVVMAADLQDPPEQIPLLIEDWRSGSQVVWAVRRERKDTWSMLAFSRLYYWLMRRVIGFKEMPASGADFLLMDRVVIDAVRRFNEHNTSLFVLVTWIGFQQSEIVYDKKSRLYGSSGWSLAKKLKLAVDSVTAFSFTPIRAMTSIGFVIALLGILYAMAITANALFGNPVEGWSSLMVVVLVLSGMQMLMLGVLGEYLWRSLAEARRRPRYLLERTVQRRNLSAPSPPAETAEPAHDIVDR